MTQVVHNLRPLRVSGAVWLQFLVSVPYLIYAARGLDFVTSAPTGDEGTREKWHRQNRWTPHR